MTIFSLYAHHEPSSFTAALKNTAHSILTAQGHTIIDTDLYGSGFEPKADKIDFNTSFGGHFNYMLEQKNAANHNMAFSPDILAEMEKLAQADLLLIHTPIWWLSVPAVLKGWFDRVLAMGVAWDGGKIYENGMLKGKTAMLCVVAGGPKEFFRADGRHKATIDNILHPIQHGTLAFCGMDVLEPFVVFNALGLTEEQRLQVVKEYQFRIEHIIDSPSYYIIQNRPAI
jgi:NAD(P)H dehydrogenase (quinone)